MYTDKRNAFTLIELLVVIAIIAILAAILFPVFAKAREKARQTTCASNEKQLGLGFIQYTQDYDECPPNGSPPGAGQCAHSGGGWAAQVYPYVKSTGVFTCPDDLSIPSGTNTEVSYIYNSGNAFNAGAAGYTTQQACDASGNVSMWVINKYVAPTKTVLLAEGRMPSNTGASIKNGAEIGGYVSLNGVAGQLAVLGLTGSNCNGGSPNAVCGYTTGFIGGYSGASHEYFLVTGNNNAIPGSDFVGLHSGGANYLFFDGHVKWLMPNMVSSGGNNATVGDCGNGSTTGSNTNCGTYAATFSIF